jgi:hypothetical protein
MRRLTKPFWLLLGALFLFEAWVWDACVRLGRAAMALVPWENLKGAIARSISRLPPYATLALFLIPLAIIEPFKIVSLWLIAKHHWILGAAGFVAAKFVGFGLVAFLFDCTRDKLLSIAWVAAIYRLMMRWRDWAHELLAPYKAQVSAALAAFRAMSARVFGENQGGLWRKLRRFRRLKGSAPRL